MHRWSPLPIFLLALTLTSSIGCSPNARVLALSQPASLDTLNVRLIGRIVGMEGTEKEGLYKVENRIGVVAVHRHMVHENLRVFLLHYWGVGPAEQLARGVKAALDQTGR